MSLILNVAQSTLGVMTMLNVSALTVGARLRAARRAADLEQAEVARLMKVSRHSVSNWERDIFQPTVSQFITWAQITGQPAERLIEGLPGAQKAPTAGESESGPSYTPRDLNPEPTDSESVAICPRCGEAIYNRGGMAWFHANGLIMCASEATDSEPVDAQFWGLVAPLVADYARAYFG